MKTTDLMIGDWVIYNPNVFIEDEYEPTKDSYPIQIKSGEDIDLVIEDCYCPIPITPKILEKNGFKKQDGKEWICHKYENDDKNKVSLYNILWNMDEEYLEISSFTNATGDFNRFGVCYVHELQHALKACGIEKEIAV